MTMSAYKPVSEFTTKTHRLEEKPSCLCVFVVTVFVTVNRSVDDTPEAES